MPSLRDLLDRISHRFDRSAVHVECRRCGRTLSQDSTSCPCCGSTEIATISL